MRTITKLVKEGEPSVVMRANEGEYILYIGGHKAFTIEGEAMMKCWLGILGSLKNTMGYEEALHNDIEIRG